MAVNKMNKITGLKPEEELFEEFHGPFNSLKETVQVAKKIKTELRELEHYIEKHESSDKNLKSQLQNQVIKTKQEMVRLARLLEEHLEGTAWLFDDDKGDQKPKPK